MSFSHINALASPVNVVAWKPHPHSAVGGTCSDIREGISVSKPVGGYDKIFVRIQGFSRADKKLHLAIGPPAGMHG